jgi:hypothetical protein
MFQRLLQMFALFAALLFSVLLVGCGNDKPSPARTSPAVVPAPVASDVAPDDADPAQVRNLRQETADHAAATAVTPPAAPISTPTAAPVARPDPAPTAPPPPESRPWQAAGVLVVFSGNETDAHAHAASLRYELAHHDAGSWTNTVDAVHVYEKTWATRVSPVMEAEARALCAWLDVPPKPSAYTWLALGAGTRGCRYTPKPTLTSKTEYADLRGAGH